MGNRVRPANVKIIAKCLYSYLVSTQFNIGVENCVKKMLSDHNEVNRLIIWDDFSEMVRQNGGYLTSHDLMQVYMEGFRYSFHSKNSLDMIEALKALAEIPQKTINLEDYM